MWRNRFPNVLIPIVFCPMYEVFVKNFLILQLLLYDREIWDFFQDWHSEVWVLLLVDRWERW